MRVRTLIVDDEPDMRTLLREHLAGFPGFEVCGEATNGAEAIDQALANQPDLVLLDVLMPVMGGVVALPLIREAAPNAKVVFLTVLDEPIVMGMALDDLPADAVLLKHEFMHDPDGGYEVLRRLAAKPKSL